MPPKRFTCASKITVIVLPVVGSPGGAPPSYNGPSVALPIGRHLPRSSTPLSVPPKESPQ
jgi:hypothetical protein